MFIGGGVAFGNVTARLNRTVFNNDERNSFSVRGLRRRRRRKRVVPTRAADVRTINRAVRQFLAANTTWWD